MRKLVGYLFLLLLAFGTGFAASRWNPFKKDASRLESYLGEQFSPCPYPLQSRPFVFVVIGHNNGAAVQKTLSSLFSQSYENFRIVYVDDGSTDGSFELARDLIYNSEHLLRISLVRNEERSGELASLVTAIGQCQDDEIVAVISGEDWLAHEWVLQELNRYYANPDLWLTYGQSIDFPEFKKGTSRPFLEADAEESGFRGHPFISSHLKTFYAALFKQIQEADFIFQGKTLPAACEMAYMIPMLEMGKHHFQYIPTVLYVCNKGLHKMGEEKELQARCERFVRSLNEYQELPSLVLTKGEN